MTARWILLIEDNESDVELTRRALRICRIDNELIVVDDGQQALDYLWGEGDYAGRDPNEQPALTLLDLHLPKNSGLDSLRRMRSDARTRRNPVVILTSSREDADVAAAYELGVNSYVRKPVEFENFVNLIDQLGQYWLALNEPARRP